MTRVDSILRSGIKRLKAAVTEERLLDTPIDVFDLFSGCGGLSFGFHQIEKECNIQVVGAADIDQHANATYARNFGLVPENVDLGALDTKEIVSLLERRSRPGAMRVVLGGPPCQGFSSHRKKDPRKDERNSLVLKFAEIAIALGADVVVLENVPDICAKKHVHHFAGFRETLTSAGYSVSTGILNFAHFGTPQERFRTVAIASKVPFAPLPEPVLERDQFVTVREAIGGLQPLAAGSRSRTDEMHRTSRHRQSTLDILNSVPRDGGSRPTGIGPACLDRTSGFSDVYGRLAWDKASITITARCRTPSCGRFAHPTQNRGLTVREAALLQGFPSWWLFEGPFDDMFKQVGNAVPPTASIAITHSVLRTLSGTGLKDEPYSDPSELGVKSFSSLIAHSKVL